MIVKKLSIPEVCLIELKKICDERGFLSEVYSKRQLMSAGINGEWVQDNHVFSQQKETLRGLHFQRPPHAQAKRVRVSRGAIYDVAVDIRLGSPFYGQWTSAVISAQSWNEIFVPKGFAHGYLTLEPDCEVLYAVDEYYAPQAEGGILWNDPDLGINWPVGDQAPLVSSKDQMLPPLAQANTPFAYGEVE